MRVELSLKKSLEENAGIFFDKAKKSKKRLKGAKEALERSFIRLEELKNQKLEVKEKKVKRKKEWYEKFRWFISSEGFLCIGGRDATTNEIVIKKHTDAQDLVMHTDMAGSPFFVIKDGQKAGLVTLEETAIATASFSRAWKLGMATLDVFYVKPEQVSKKAKAGESLAKGAFMIYGETKYLHPNVGLAVGSKDGVIMAGALEAVRKNCDKFVEIKQGREKTSAAAKKIQKKIGGELDDIIRALPSGGCEVKK